MIWQNPWALAGLLAVALPVVIHWLGRGRARVVRFPSVRFLAPSRLLPARRTRMHDPLLLVVRACILAAAAAALAQPYLMTAGRRRALGDPLARAIIVDTSASMRRRTHDGDLAVVWARAHAARLADSAQASVVLETNDPARSIPGAVDWLRAQPSRGQLVIVSDFQLGMLAVRDLAGVPRPYGVRLDPAPIADSSLASDGARVFDRIVTASAQQSDAGSSIDWRAGPSSVDTSMAGMRLLGGAAERDVVGAARRAAAGVGVPLPVDTAGAVALVFPGYERRAELLRDATDIRAAWMVTIVRRLRNDPLLARLAAVAVRVTVADSIPRIVVAANDAGDPIVVATQSAVDGRDHLVLLDLTDAASPASAELIAATARARSGAPPTTELESRRLRPEELLAWQREPATEATPRTGGNGSDGASDGRWLWVAALLLLVAETGLRRGAGRRAGQTAARPVEGQANAA